MSDLYVLMKWFGAFAYDYEGKGTGTKSCEVCPTPSGIDLKIGEEQISLSAANLDLSYGGENNNKVMVKVESPSKSFSLMIKDKKFVRPWKEMDLGPDMAEKLELLMEDKGRKGSTNLIWFFGIVLTLVLGYWGITSAYRAGIEAAADAVPQEWQARLGEAGASSIMQESYLWDHREAQNLLDQLGERLEGELSEKEQSIDFEFYIIDQPAVNAFALPGGKIFFYRGLLEEAETVDEIAGVMAHEMIHVTKSHGLRNLLNQIGLTVALTIFLGDVQGLEQIIFQNVASLGALSYGREQETEADIKGLELIYAAGLDPEGMIAFFQKLLEDNEYDFSAEIFSTHPDTKNRIQVLKDLMAEMGDLEDPWLEKPNFDFDLSSGQAVRY